MSDLHPKSNPGPAAETWTEARTQQLRELWDAQPRVAASAIGKLLGISKNAVVGKAHRLGLDARPSPIRPGQRKPGATPVRRAKAIVLQQAESDEDVRTLPPAPVFQPRAKPIMTRRQVTLLDEVRRPSYHRACQFIEREGEHYVDKDKCGAATLTGRSYCREHAEICYLGVTALKARAA